MKTSFKKSLLLCPERYSLNNSFMRLLQNCSEEVVRFDVRTKISNKQLRFNAQLFRFPNTIRSKFENSFLLKANKLILDEFNRVQPDLVFIYNSEFIIPETCEVIKKRARIIFFMGDSPFFTPANNHYLSLLKYGDLVLSPDSFWISQLNMIGISKTSFFIPEIANDHYYPLDKNSIDNGIHETEILYVGNSYVNSWGYKKALLMNHFTGFNFELYGSAAWRKWFKDFPGLDKKFIQSEYIETEKLNKMFNKARIIPVDGNPGIISGLHVRALEALGAGSLPLIEYRRDVDTLIFNDFGSQLPIITNYSKAKDLASYYLKNDAERIDLVSKMREFIVRKYNAVNNAELIVNRIAFFSK